MTAPRRFYTGRLRLGGVVPVALDLVVAIHSAPSSVLGAALVFLGLLPLNVISYRWATLRVDASSEGVSVRNVYRTLTVPWSEISEFVVGPEFFPSAMDVLNLVVVCKDGRRVRALGVADSRTPARNPRKAMNGREVAATLNAMLAESQALPQAA